MKDFFDEKDFIPWSYGLTLTQRQQVAYAANTKLNTEKEEKWKVVYGQLIGGDLIWGPRIHDGRPSPTHVGYLAFVEEIKKECQGHEPYLFSNAVHRQEGSRWLSDENYRCIHCQVPLEAKWTAKAEK